jgi:hypothetical protein
MLVADKLGMSVAVMFKLLQPKNASLILVHAVVPHCFTSNNLGATAALPIIILWKLVGEILNSMLVLGKLLMVKVAPEKVPEPVDPLGSSFQE